MADYNSFSFIGRLVTDLEITQGTADREGYARGRMANNGFREDNNMFLTVFFPESVISRKVQYMSIGKPLLVSGRLTQDSYTDKNGVERQGLKVNATSVDFVSTGRPEAEQSGGTTTGRMSTASPSASNSPRSNENEEDLPF